jgi:6,7-dimethyl-8-ribityllumazine synthase
MNQTSTTPLPSGAEPRVAIVAARWHADIVDRACASFADELVRHGWPPDRIERVDVPGAFEIPLQAQRLARSGRFAAVAAFALVVDGGIYRHDFVAASVVDALMRVQLATGVPVLSVVLTPQAFHEHDEHRRFFGAHMVVKGREAAVACLRVNAIRAQVPTPA